MYCNSACTQCTGTVFLLHTGMYIVHSEVHSIPQWSIQCCPMLRQDNGRMRFILHRCEVNDSQNLSDKATAAHLFDRMHRYIVLH
jgi:hypothetical protein